MQAKTDTDLYRRFTPTPIVADLRVMTRTIRLETNSRAIMAHVQQALRSYGEAYGEAPQFHWRLVEDAEAGLKPPWPDMSAFSNEGLRLVNFGQRSFLAADLEAREAVGFLAEELAQDVVGFTELFLSRLFIMTAETLGLCALSAACVGLGEKGLLVFGPAQSGKTTSCYLAAKMGLKFHADQVVFVEPALGRLRAWGEFWPAVFYPETLGLLPELAPVTRPFTCSDRTFLAMEKDPSGASEGKSVIPVACVFLEREGVEEPSLLPLDCGERAARLKRNCLFMDAGGWLEPERISLLRRLNDLPAYRLAYGGDAAVAAGIFRSLLGNQDGWEGHA